MPNIEDYETPEALLEAAIETVRRANGVKLYELPMEATEAQRAALKRELLERHPWHKVLCINYHSAPGDGRPIPPPEEIQPIEVLRERVTAI